MTALQLIRLLRPFALGRGFSAHLTECALYEIVDRGFAPWLPALRKRNVLGFVALSNSTGPTKFIHPCPERVM